jgi:acetyltransferase-like isoleucine patch superfamily enzyme/glycosyltransferase involved in cell wall biosynthesis
MLDVLILTHNEELNLPHTLASVSGLATRVFVVDSCSTDRTAAIAQEHGAELVTHQWEGYARQKNWALDKLPLQSPWTLIIDADESLTPELAEEIRKVISRPPEQVAESAFYLNRVLIFMGGEIRHCGYFPSWNIRLFKRGTARYEERHVHEHMIVQGSIGHLKGLMRHEDRRGLEHYIAKHNRYSTLEARELYRQVQPWPGFVRFMRDRVARRRFIKYRLATKVATPWALRFFYMYVLRGGFLDRQAGLPFCLFISSYELFIRMKYQDLVWARGEQQSGTGGLAIPEGGMHPLRRSARALPRPSLARSRPGTSTRVVRLHGEVKPIMRQANSRSFEERAAGMAWTVVQSTAFLFSPRGAYGWRSFLLRMFGARLGRKVRVNPTVRVEMPWNLSIGDHSMVGDRAILYCLGRVKIGSFVTISQYAHLCAATHDARTRRMEVLRLPITIGDDVWVAADAFVGPGVTLGNRTILGARASAFSDLPAEVLAVGNPARAIRKVDFEADRAALIREGKPTADVDGGRSLP